jgi:hypothetical protein
MTSLKSLTFTTLPRSTVSPTLDRRTKITARLEEQKALLRDPGYMRVVRAWGKNDSGEKSWSTRNSACCHGGARNRTGRVCSSCAQDGSRLSSRRENPPLPFHPSINSHQSSTRSLQPFEPVNSTSSWRTQARKRRRRRQRENRGPAAVEFQGAASVAPFHLGG